MTHYQERALNSVLPAGDSMVADFKYGSPYEKPSFVNDNVLPQHQGGAIAEQLAQAGQVLLEAVPQAMRGTTLFTLDAMVDAQDRVWLLEMNSNPMVHPDVYPVMMARLYEAAEQTMQPVPAPTA
jgi:D-alanine-D-alanine ligase-like ATP-grasp enzyme